MSIDKETLEAIGQMMDTKLAANIQVLRTEVAQNVHELRTEMAQMEGRIINQVNAIIESKVTPQIQLIAEQHGDIIKKLNCLEARKETSQALRSHVKTLEVVVESHTERIEELEAKIG